MNMRKRTRIQVILALVLCLVMGTACAKDPDESGVGGTGHKPKIIVDPDMLDDLDLPERVEIPEAIESFDAFDAEAGSAVDAADDVAPPDSGDK
jgi:hypothetical protein